MDYEVSFTQATPRVADYLLLPVSEDVVLLAHSQAQCLPACHQVYHDKNGLNL